jgi:long-chain acyl-CoA synthetase
LPTSLFDSFRDHIGSRPDAIAITFLESEGDRCGSLSWSELGRVVAQVSRQLRPVWRDQSSRPRTLGYASDNTLGDVVVALAAMALGVVEVPLDHRLGEVEMHRRWCRVGGYWLSTQRRDEWVRRAVGDAGSRAWDPGELSSGIGDPHEPALVLWTSGTTGQPQGVTLSHRNLYGNAAAKLTAVPQTVADIRLCVLPLSHAYARTCDFGTWLISGGSLAVALGFDGWSRIAARVRPTVANVVPALACRLLEGDADDLGLGRLRLLGCGGAGLAAARFEDWRRRGVTVIQGYGLTETSPVICSATPQNAAPGLVGGFVDGWEHDLREGRLFVRGPHVMLGYWGNPPATAARIDPDGWLDTRDLVEIDAATGQLRVLGRVDDVLVLASGRKFNPVSLERDIETSVAGVAHAILVAIDGQLQLWLDADGEVDRSAIEALIDARPHWQRPRRIAWFPEPLSLTSGELTAKGTIRRRRIMERRFAAASCQPNPRRRD